MEMLPNSMQEKNSGNAHCLTPEQREIIEEIKKSMKEKLLSVDQGIESYTGPNVGDSGRAPRGVVEKGTNDLPSH